VTLAPHRPRIPTPARRANSARRGGGPGVVPVAGVEPMCHSPGSWDHPSPRTWDQGDASDRVGDRTNWSLASSPLPSALLAGVDGPLLEGAVGGRVGVLDGGLEARPVGLALDDEVVGRVLEAVDGALGEEGVRASNRTPYVPRLAMTSIQAPHLRRSTPLQSVPVTCSIRLQENHRQGSFDHRPPRADPLARPPPGPATATNAAPRLVWFPRTASSGASRRAAAPFGG
jgi:hypothetical protein